MATMYALLVVGAVWMVYPFLLMLSGSTKSDVDIRQFDIVPRFFHDDTMLFRKFEEQRYGGSLDAFTAATRYRNAEGRPLYSFEFLEPPQPVAPAVIADWREFLATSRDSSIAVENPPWFFTLGHNGGFKTVPELAFEYQRRLWRAYPNLSRKDVYEVLRPEEWVLRRFQQVRGPYAQIYSDYRASLAPRYFFPTSVEGNFIMTQLQPRFGTGRDAVERLNREWGTNYKNLYDVSILPTPPTQTIQREVWWTYVRDNLSVRFIRFDASLSLEFRSFLQKKYGAIAKLNEIYGVKLEGFDAVSFPDQRSPIAAFSDVESFLQTLKSPDGISLDSADFRWREFLRAKYKSASTPLSAGLDALNSAHGASYASFDEVTMPTLAHDWQTMQENKRAIVREMATRNYRIVFNELALRGHAFKNTLIFCLLNVVTALIINPLAAYALSRFQPRWGTKALFLLMATMAFPAEVTQIPAFLMLREMGWLNTFAALVIPAAANGFSIFLLKGFFDSLPKELYESATLDGASELRIFCNITMPLSAPILAVIALGAFTAAYGAFMFALLVCQHESMWTLMVYLYQLQQDYGTPVIFAGLALAAIPTLLVFVFCQNIILRGIVVPVEK